VSIQFCAKHPTSKRALQYTRKLHLLHKVQHRTLRATSIDSHYVAAAYKYMRNYELWLSELLLVSVKSHFFLLRRLVQGNSALYLYLIICLCDIVDNSCRSINTRENWRTITPHPMSIPRKIKRCAFWSRAFCQRPRLPCSQPNPKCHLAN
jgi:hypothetical protein